MVFFEGNGSVLVSLDNEYYVEQPPKATAFKLDRQVGMEAWEFPNTRHELNCRLLLTHDQERIYVGQNVQLHPVQLVLSSAKYTFGDQVKNSVGDVLRE